MRLSHRGQIALAVLLGSLILSLVTFLMHETTPKQCRVPLAQQSQWCIDFNYPH
jgi:hypothetical protein